MTTSDGQSGHGELPNYGSAPAPQVGPALPAGASPQNKKALWSMITGLVAFLGLCCAIGGLLGGVAIALGIIGRREITATGGLQGGMGMAMTGIVTGAIAVTGAVVMMVLIAVGSSVDGTLLIN